jgi:hypothetical protein
MARSARDHESDFFIQGEPSEDDPGALGENGRDFIRADFYYGRDMGALVSALDAIRTLYRTAHIAMSCRLYRAVTGADLPLLIFTRSAANKTQYAAEESKLAPSDREILARQLEQAKAHSKKVESLDLFVHQDLSYHVPAGAS